MGNHSSTLPSIKCGVKAKSRAALGYQHPDEGPDWPGGGTTWPWEHSGVPACLPVSTSPAACSAGKRLWGMGRAREAPSKGAIPSAC